MDDWPLPAREPGAPLLRVDPVLAASFVRRFTAAALKAGAAAELDRLLAEELPPSEDSRRLLRALLWDCLDAGLEAAVAALLRAGAKVWRREAFVRECRLWPADRRLAGIWHQAEESISLCFYQTPFITSPHKKCYLFPWRRAPDADHAPAYRVLFDAGAPVSRFLGQIGQLIRGLTFGDHVVVVTHSRQILWWLEILCPRDPGRTRMNAQQILLVLQAAPPALAGIGDLTVQCQELICGIAEWRPLRAAWVGAVVRSCMRR